jgi:hypothetical protein
MMEAILSSGGEGKDDEGRAGCGCGWTTKAGATDSDKDGRCTVTVAAKMASVAWRRRMALEVAVLA